MMLSEREYVALVTATADADVTAFLAACMVATLAGWALCDWAARPKAA